MASYLITETIRTACASPGSFQGSRPGSHVSSVVLDRGGAYLVTDIYDFMEHGHSFMVDHGAADPLEPVTGTRCPHCGRPTLRIAVDPSTAVEFQDMDVMSNG